MEKLKKHIRTNIQPGQKLVTPNTQDKVWYMIVSLVLQDHILRDLVIYGMYLDFDKVLNDLSDVILDLYLSGFNKKDFIPPKAQYVLASALFNKTVQDMDVKFDMTVRYKTIYCTCG